MEYVIGIVLALGVSLSASLLGLDRDRAFYPVVMIVIASYYGLFAIMAGSIETLAAESLPMAAFLAAAIFGFKRNLWLVVAALLAHGIFDFVHGHLISNAGVPSWWPMFCLAYDIAAAACLSVLLRRARIAVRA